TDSTPARSESEPNTSLINALGSLSGVFTDQSMADHQKIRWNSARRPCIFVSVEPLRSKKTFGFQRAISAAHSYSGLPQWAPTRVIFGKRSEEHTSELQSRGHLVCRLLLEKKKKNINKKIQRYTVKSKNI